MPETEVSALNSEYEALKAQAKAATEAEDYEQALQLYQQALDLEPESPDALVDLGNAYGKLNQHEESKKLYHQVLAIQPDFWRALNNVGWVLYIEKEDYLEALRWLKTALILSPDAFITLSNIGRTYLELGIPEQAESFLRQAISNKPKEFWGYVYLSTCLNKQKKYQQALEIALLSEAFVNPKDKHYNAS